MELNLITKNVTDGHSNKISEPLNILSEKDRKKIGAVYTKYHKRIRAYIISLKVPELDADGLAQDVFTQLCYDFLKGRKIKYTRSYLFGIAVHIAHRYRRQANQLSTITLSNVLENLSTCSSANRPGIIRVKGKAEKDISIKLLRKTIADLPEKYRVALELRYIQNLPVSIAAQHAACSEKTFYQRVSRAIKTVRAQLDLF